MPVEAPDPARQPVVIRPLFPALCALVLAAAVFAAEPSILEAYQLTRQGTSDMLAGNAERALDRFQRAVSVVPGFPPAQMALGHMEMSEGSFQQALERYLAAIRGYEQLGDRIHEVERARYADAQAAIVRLEQEVEANERKLDRQLIREQPSQERIARHEARIEAYRSQIEQLRAVASPSPDIEGAPGEAYLHLGNAFFRLQKYRDAVEAWRTCATRMPGLGLVHQNLALAYLKLGEKDAARESLAEAKRLGYAVHPRLQARVSGS
jgi:tetratricopeptide (TPR) repeat protein